MFLIIQIGSGTRPFLNWTGRDFPICNRLWIKMAPTLTDMTTISFYRREPLTGRHQLEYHFVDMDDSTENYMVSRLETDGLKHTKELFTLEGVTKYRSFTSLQVKTNLKLIHKIGMKFLEDLEIIMKSKERNVIEN